MPSPPSASIHGENNPYQPASSARGDTRPTFVPPPPLPQGQRHPVARPPHAFKSKTLGHLARSTSAEVDNEVAIALASGRSIVSKTDWKEEDAQYLVELIEKQFPKGNIVWDWVGQQMADRGFTKNQCRSKWKRIRTKALLATEYGMKLKDAEENEIDDDDNDGKSAQKAILGLTKSLNDFGAVSDRPSSLLFSNRYQNRTASSSERPHRALPSRSQISSNHAPGRGGRYYLDQSHGQYDNDGEVDELWSDNEDTQVSGHQYRMSPPYPPAGGAATGVDPLRHEYPHHRHYTSTSPGSSRHGSLSEQGTSMPRTIFDYSHEPSSTHHHHPQHHHIHHRSKAPAATSASEVTVAVATSEGTGVTEEVLSEIAATPTSFGKIEWKPEDSDYLVELIQTKFKSRKVDWGWIAQQMEGRGYDKAQCKSRWWRVQHRSHNRNGSQGGNSIGTMTSSRGKRASMSQSDDASVHEDDRPATAAQAEEDESKSEARTRDYRQWGSAEYEDVNMAEEPVHPPVRSEDAQFSMPALGKSESQRGYRSATATGTRTTGTGPESPHTPSGPTQKHIEWKEEDSQFMFKMIEREFPVGNIVWSVIAERMASRGYSQTQCMSKWRRHLKSMKKSADEQTGMDIDADETAPAYQQHQQHLPHRPVDPQGGSSRPVSPHYDNDYEAYDSYRSRKRFNGSEQFQQHVATHFQHPPPYGHPSSSSSSNSSSRGAPIHYRSASGYSQHVEAEYDRYYDASGHHRFDSYSADQGHTRTGDNKQHDRYPSYGSEYTAFMEDGRRRMDRPRPSEYADDRDYYEHAGGRHRHFPPHPDHNSHTYPPRYPDVEPERSRSIDRRRDYHHYPQETQGDSDRYGASRMIADAGGMVSASHRGDFRPYNERDRYRYDIDGGGLYGQDDMSNPSKRAKRVQPNEYGPDDYYDSMTSYSYPPPPTSAFARRDGPPSEYNRRRERSSRLEQPYGRRSPPTALLARGHDLPETREHGDWEARVNDPRLSPTPPMSSATAPVEYRARRSNQPSPAASEQPKQQSPLPRQHQQLTELGTDVQRKVTPGERSPPLHPMEAKEEETRLGKNEESEESGRSANNPPPADTTGSTPTPSVAQANHRPAPSPLPASHPRMYDREQKDNTTPEPRASVAIATTAAAPAAARREMSPAPPPIRPPLQPHAARSQDRGVHGQEGYYYDDEYYGSRNRDRASSTWNRDDYYHHPRHYGPPSSRRSHPSMTAVAAATSGAPDHDEHHRGHSGGTPYPPPQHPSHRMPPPPPPASSDYRVTDDGEGHDAHRRREEWLDRGRYEMSDMQQLAAELERQGRKWDTIRREIRIPRLTSPFDEHEREHEGGDNRGRMMVDEYPQTYHRSQRLSYGSSYGNGSRRHPSSPPPPARPNPQSSSTAMSSSSRANVMASPPLRSSAGGRRRSFAVSAGGPASSSSSQPPASYPSPMQHRSQPPYSSYHDRPSSSSTSSAHPMPPNNNNYMRSSLQPHFSYSHFGTSSSFSPGQTDHRQGAVEGPHASKRGRSPDATERDDEGSFVGNIPSHPVIRKDHGQYKMGGEEEDMHGEQRGRPIGEPHPVSGQDQEQDQIEHDHDVVVVQHSTKNEAEHLQHQHRQREGNQSRPKEEEREAEELLSQEDIKDSEGEAIDEGQMRVMADPDNNTSTTTATTTQTRRETPQKDEPFEGNETMVISAGKDDSQAVNTKSG
ncbi:hypothetical protein DFQ27_006888 [Actinomortierella ambigua]|uniref:Myb-like domain-containing protein n=1 Tax=Actinomortierella ambigua TaxID=1343610 RepID=A0A9P6QJ47_9FUNG|nr:hypothetical protein DFQ27_006888 [Actinomortierella ambigua]